MAYKVGFPKNKENFAEAVSPKPESSGSVPLLKNTGVTGDGDRPDDVAGASVVEQVIENGEIVAVLICSKVLQAHIWLAFEDDFDPQDGQAVFYPVELPMLREKTPEQLREIHRVKLAGRPGARVRE